ncbi:MAG: ester cyclase [Anaerolineales bacterium]
MTQQPITDLGQQQDISSYMNPGAEKRQSLKGFDDDYVDIVDYIVRCTHKIWEGQGIGLIYSHYRHNAVIHTSDGLTYGRDKVIADSLRTMAAFPDIRLFADDVIWSGNDEDGFHSSHRIGWVGHNTGYSLYGPPTGRRVVRYGIAHCFVRENRVVEEWICRDELALIRQLGFDEHALARKFAAQEAALGLTSPQPINQGEIERVEGQETPEALPSKTSEGFDVEDFIRRGLHDIWNWRLLNRIRDCYSSTYVARAPAHRQLYGRGDLRAYILALMAAFPDLALGIDHVCSVGDERNGYRVATRWTLQGTHLGPGVYGEPTGKRMRVIGITHHELNDARIAREWMLFDEFALLKQLYRP